MAYSAEQWRDHYALRARRCSTDAVACVKANRPDIAALLRKTARDYLQMARYAAFKASA